MKKNKRKIDKKLITQSKLKEIIREKPSTTKFHHILSISLILLISIAIYSNTLKNGFVYDDKFTIVNNTLIKDFSNLSKLWTKEYFTTSGEMSYRPVVTLTYFLDYAVYGIKPWGYHLTNLILHAINGVLLYIFLFQLLAFSPQPSVAFKPLYFSLFSSLIFITHPVLTEAVNAISFREDLLCFLFFISALILYLKNSRLKAQSSKFKAFSLQLSAFSFYFLALLSKEMAITLPLIIILYEWIYGGKEQSPLTSPLPTPSLNSSPLAGEDKGGGLLKGERDRVRGKELGSIFLNPYIIGYIAVTVFYLYLRFFLFHNPVAENIHSWALFERFMTLPYLIFKYLLLLLAPVSLSADYVITPIQFLISLKFIIPFIIVAVLVSVSVNRVRASKTKSQVTSYQLAVSIFGILFLLITLLPVYNIIPIANPFAERYLYLPMLGFAIIIGSILTWLMAHIPFKNITGQGSWRIPYRSLLIAHCSLLIIISIYSFAVIKRNKIWLDDYSLWSDTVRKIPESSRAHNNLGIVYSKQDKFDEAIREYKLVLFLKPDYPEAYNNLGNAYYDKGLVDKAIEYFQIAVKLKPDYPEAYYNLGYAYYDKGLVDKAIGHFQIALKLKPNYPEAYNNLGTIYGTSGLLDRAIEQYQITIKLKPDYPEAHYNMGNALVGQERYSDAIPHYIEAIKIKPNYAEAHNNLGSAYVKLRQWENALKEWNDTLTLDPKNENARQNRDMVMRMLGR